MQDLLIIRGIVASLSPDDKKEVEAVYKKIETAVNETEHKELGYVALAWAGIEIASKEG
jgi:hypothetical protein